MQAFDDKNTKWTIKSDIKCLNITQIKHQKYNSLQRIVILLFDFNNNLL
jgi:hypothetical protein